MKNTTWFTEIFGNISLENFLRDIRNAVSFKL